MSKKTLVIGAGEAGKMVAKEILDSGRLKNQFSLSGFLDDDDKKKSVWGIPVIGKLNILETVLSEHKIEQVIIAIPSASRDVITDLIVRLSKTGVPTKIVPGIFEIIEGDVSFKQIREVKPEDLLGREEIGFETGELLPYYKDKTVMVTGGGGSIGSEIIRQLLKLPVKKVVALGRGENNLNYLLTSITDKNRIDYVVGDVKDYDKIFYEMNAFKPDIVFHAAAHKHVPMMEDYPEEAVKNNMFGTYNAARAAINAGVKDFVLVSTDKAVLPKSIMGSTKRMAEKIVLSLNRLNKTRFIFTRFGNVLGSRGSVIPTFMKQIQKGGPVTITHPDICRYFMSIPEASRLVIKSVTVKEGHIFVLDMGRPIKILELAKNLIRFSGLSEEEIPIVFTGLRKGEKINEVLHQDKEQLKPTRFKKLMVLDDEEFYFTEKELTEMFDNFIVLIKSMDRNKIRSLLSEYLKTEQFSVEN